ncbi:hypothetical protein CVT24_001919 [Panaeolus cyanescens]|uniref:Uncharacterized protein n=1 Tax=Panaeolus cyanescens TaxID=181874 RepID=A0A409X2L5_9AGAR|nr:hypothetical protein CVT24_001919 [Panaeolus cyanescens]
MSLPDFMLDPNVVLKDGLVQNLVKNWEKEASYKVDPNEWRTISKEKYVFNLNGGKQNMSADDMLQIGTYSTLIGKDGIEGSYELPAMDFTKSHKLFKGAMKTFNWEVLEVIGGPPKVFGVTVAQVNAKFEIEGVKTFWDPQQLFKQLLSEGLETLEGETVPYGCFAGPNLWNGECAQGRLSKTAQQWGDQVRNGYPGYTGSRPRMQIWHGRADTVLHYNNHGEAIKQWTNVFGYSTNPTSTLSNNPLSGWTRARYGPNFEAINSPNGHDIPTQGNEVLTWFGLIGGSTTTVAPTTTTTGTTRPPTTTTTASGAQQTQYGQCGG